MATYNLGMEESHGKVLWDELQHGLRGAQVCFWCWSDSVENIIINHL